MRFRNVRGWVGLSMLVLLPLGYIFYTFPNTLLPSDNVIDVLDDQKVIRDFGISAPGVTLRQVFFLKNTTSHKISIRQIQMSCRCVKSTVSERNCNSGDSLSLSVYMETPQKSVDVAQFVDVLFNEKDAGPVRIELRASVRQRLSLSVRELQWNAENDGAYRTKTFLVENFGDNDWAGIIVTSEEGWLGISVVPEGVTNSVARQSWRVSVTPTLGDFEPCEKRGELQVEVEGEVFPGCLARIPVLAVVPPRVLAFPNSWFVHESFNRNQELTTKLVFRDPTTSRVHGGLVVSLSTGLQGLIEVNTRVDESNPTVVWLDGRITRPPIVETRGEISIQCGNVVLEKIPVHIVVAN